jgi:hypothetical protein
MVHPTLRFLIGCLALAVFAGFSAAGCDDATSKLSETTATGSGGGGAGGAGVGAGIGIGGGISGEGLAITPADPILQVVYGSQTSIQFNAVNPAGHTLPAAWSINTSVAGTISDTGLFLANGTAGGEVEITAKYGDDTATTTLSIHLTATENPGNVSPADQTALMAPGGQSDPNWKIVYPYDGTVFPRGILPPEVHLNGPGGATSYYLNVKTGNCQYHGFFSALPQIQMSQGMWDALGACSDGTDSFVHIAKLVAGQKFAINRKWRIAQGKLKGVVYYNTYDSQLAGFDGAIMRIAGNSPSPVVWQGYCTVCHSVSADGSTGAAANHSGQGGFFDLSTNTPNPPATWTTSELAAFAGLYPDGSVAVIQGAPGGSYPPNTPGTIGTWTSELRTKTGDIIPNSGIEPFFAQTPVFSPDGTKLAFCNRSGTSPYPSQLAMMNYDAVTQKFSGFQILTIPPNGAHYSWPSFTPDGKFVVYQAGIGDDLATWSNNTGRLWMIDPATKQGVALDRLNGDGYMPAGARDENLNYEPSILPVSSGGYYWVMFTSRRTYGNRLTGNRDQTKRLWVAAFDTNAQAGKDPTHPAFYIAGQELNSGNSRGFWVLEPCKQNGESCEDGTDCCQGYCNNEICAPPNENTCVPQGNTCETSADCCGDLQCVGAEGNKFCDVLPPE